MKKSYTFSVFSQKSFNFYRNKAINITIKKVAKLIWLLLGAPHLGFPLGPH